MTTDQQQQFREFWDHYVIPDLASKMQIARDAFRAGCQVGELSKITVEERVRTERNELAEHLRRVLTADIDATSRAQAYLAHIGAAPRQQPVAWDTRIVDEVRP